MGFLCPKDGCGKTLDTERGMKIHHARSHGEKISYQEVVCDWCGKKVEKRDSEVKRTSRNFCDKICKREEFASRQSGEDNPRWKEDVSMKEHACENCGETYKNYSNDDETKCCSRECYGEWLSNNWTGEDAPAWKGGRYFYYGPSWQESRQKTLESAGYECEVCGITSEKHKNEHGQTLHVHHKKKFKQFGLEQHEKANRQENLMAVCRDCHNDVERNS